MGQDFRTLSGEEQGDFAGALQYKAQTSLRVPQEAKETPEVGAIEQQVLNLDWATISGG
jgi:hypothetical protein